MHSMLSAIRWLPRTVSNAVHHLEQLVLFKIKELGEESAAEFFGVGLSLVKQWSAGSKRPSLAAVERVFDPEQYVKEFSGKVQEANWEGKKVTMLLPQYKQTNPKTLFAVMGLLDRAKMNVMMHFGDAFIVHTRNKLADRFMSTGVETSMWFDDDMVPPFGDAAYFNNATGFNLPPKYAGIHTINKLLSTQKTIIGALYFGRNEARRQMFGGADAVEQAFAHTAPHDVIRPVPWVATGALMVHRSVYEAIQNKFPQLAPQIKGESWNYFSNSETDLTSATNEALAVLKDASTTEAARLAKVEEILLRGKKGSFYNNHLSQGEDVTFCKRAAASGHQPYVDFSIVCGHMGDYCYGPRGKLTNRI